METAARPATALRLLLDEMVDPEIAVQLRRRGYDVVAVAERADLRGLLDPQLFDAARAEGRCLVTENNRDLRPLGAEIVQRGESHPGLVLITDRRFSRHDRRFIGRMVNALEALLVEKPDLTNAERWLS